MNDHPNLDDFKQRVNEIGVRRSLPSILWDDEEKSPKRKWIDGAELFSACWIFARDSGMDLHELPPEVVRTIAWGRYNDLSGSLETCPKKRLVNSGISELMTRCARTVALLDSNYLSQDQERALLSGSISDIANERGCRRSSATNLRKRAIAKLTELDSIDELLFGDWPQWFEQNASSWRAPFLRKIVWPFIKPGRSFEAVRRILVNRQQEMFEMGVQMLVEESLRGSKAVADRIAQGYHLCVAATYIDPEMARDAVAEMKAALPRRGPLYHLITERCLHLLRDDEERLRYLHSLESYLSNDDIGGDFFARYACVYYGGTSLECERRFLGTHGQEFVEFSDPDAAVCESYANLSELQYRECSLLDDINFLRCILIIRRLRLGDQLRSASKFKLRVLAQHARKSKRRSVNMLGSEITHLCGQRT